MPSTTARRHERSRRGIQAAARELILEKGPGGVSLRAIAARAGYSPAALYEYFASKDELINELAMEALARLDVRMSRVPSSLPAPAALVRLGLVYVGFARENPEDFMLVFTKLRSKRASSSVPPASSSYGRLLRVAEAGLEAGAFARGADTTAEHIAYGLWSIAHGLAMLQLTHLRDFDTDFETADRFVLAAYVAGLAAGA